MRNTEREKERQREINSFSIEFMCGIDSNTSAITCCLPESILAGNWIQEQNCNSKLRHSYMRCEFLNTRPNALPSSRVLLRIFFHQVEGVAPLFLSWFKVFIMKSFGVCLFFLHQYNHDFS